MLWSLVSWPIDGRDDNPFNPIRLGSLESQINSLDDKKERRKLKGLVSRKGIEKITPFTVTRSLNRLGEDSKSDAIKYIREVGETIGCEYILVTQANSFDTNGYVILGNFYSSK